MTERQAERLEAIKRMLMRYQAEKGLEPYSDGDLISHVHSFDQHLTYARVPTSRLEELYLEAMRHHGPYLLKVDDYIRAWDRIAPREYSGVDLRPMSERGADCSICHGTGYATVVDFQTGQDIQKECPYHCKVVMSMERAG